MADQPTSLPDWTPKQPPTGTPCAACRARRAIATSPASGAHYCARCWHKCGVPETIAEARVASSRQRSEPGQPAIYNCTSRPGDAEQTWEREYPPPVDIPATHDEQGSGDDAMTQSLPHCGPCMYPGCDRPATYGDGTLFVCSGHKRWNGEAPGERQDDLPSPAGSAPCGCENPCECFTTGTLMERSRAVDLAKRRLREWLRKDMRVAQAMHDLAYEIGHPPLAHEGEPPSSPDAQRTRAIVEAAIEVRRINKIPVGKSVRGIEEARKALDAAVDEYQGGDAHG